MRVLDPTIRRPNQKNDFFHEKIMGLEEHKLQKNIKKISFRRPNFRRGGQAGWDKIPMFSQIFCLDTGCIFWVN